MYLILKRYSSKPRNYRSNPDLHSIAYLYAIDDATITDIERVHHKHKNDGLKHGFAHVLKHEAYEQQLRSDHKDNLSCGQTHDQKAHHSYNHNHNCTRQLVKLLDSGLGIIQRMSQCSALNVGMYLKIDYIRLKWLRFTGA